MKIFKEVNSLGVYFARMTLLHQMYLSFYLGAHLSQQE